MIEVKDLVDAVTGIIAALSGMLAGALSATVTLVCGTFIAGSIDGVTGASVITSALALLGGGTIATRGMGMKGGIALVAIAATVPAVIVALVVFKFFQKF
ncbi:hypothetical protein [Pseudanabaena sp. lw0831]|uniref:hypothetical protein n=1 Tax=Pseudanabaena sp. lw0831 TaxID=1357935 RepID=UPI00191605EE|nr:hypothetical protein [Pseudanabaena sp. lw0831]